MQPKSSSICYSRASAFNDRPPPCRTPAGQWQKPEDIKNVWAASAETNNASVEGMRPGVDEDGICGCRRGRYGVWKIWMQAGGLRGFLTKVAGEEGGKERGGRRD